MPLIIGLGNPGRQYKKNRHNVGALVIEKMLEAYSLRLTAQKNLRAKLTQAAIKNKQCLLAIPQTFMNESGQAIQALAKYYKIKSKDLIIVYDDIDLPLGTIRIRENGSAGGHKGLESVISQLKTQEFVRVRLGIGPQPEKIPSEKYVLQNFKRDEWKILQDIVIPKTAEAIETIFKNGVAKAMSDFN